MTCPAWCILTHDLSLQVALNDVEVSIVNIQKLAKEFEVCA